MFFRLSRTHWALYFSCLCMFALGLADNIRGPLFPELINFFKISNSTGSLSFAFASGAAFFGTAGAALLLRKFHLDRLMAIAMLLMAMGGLIMAASQNYYLFAIGAIIFGFSMGATGMGQNLLLTENFSGNKQAKALSGLHSVYGLSSLLAPFLASRSPHFFSEHISQFSFLGDWKSAFYITAFFSFIVLILILLTRAEPDFEYAKPEKSSNAKNKNFWALAMISCFFASYVGAEILVSTRLALYMRTYFNMNLEESSNYVTYFFVFLLAGRLFYAFKTPKLSLKFQMNASLLISLLCLFLGLWVHPFFLAVVGIGMAPFYPMAVAYIADITGQHKRQYISFVMGVQSLYVIAMHVGVGYLTDSFGLFYAFGVGIILLVLSLVCLNAHPKISL